MSKNEFFRKLLNALNQHPLEYFVIECFNSGMSEDEFANYLREMFNTIPEPTLVKLRNMFRDCRIEVENYNGKPEVILPAPFKMHKQMRRVTKG